MSISGQKRRFLEKKWLFDPWLAPASKVVLELFVWGLISYLSMKKKFRHFLAKNVRPIFLFLPHIFGHISSILVMKKVLDSIFQSTIVTYNFCMIPHSLIFSFNFTRFGLKQNPTGLQEAIQRSDKNSKTTLIIKSTLERSFLMKKTPKNHFWNIALFTRFNLDSCKQISWPPGIGGLWCWS